MEESCDSLLSLLGRIRAGEEAAMETFYNATVNRVYGLAMKIVSRPDLAEEVVGDVFMQVWKQAARFDQQRAAPLAWLLMICRSRSLDKLRREQTATRNQLQEKEHNQAEDTSTAIPLDVCSDAEAGRQVAEALKILNSKQRQTIALAFYHGMSHQEISDYTDEPLGTVKSNLRRAQAILRTALIRQGLEPERVDQQKIVDGGLYGEA